MPDPAADTLVADARVEKGITPRHIKPDEIAIRALLAMVSKSCLLLSEGIAARPSDIDVVLTNGYGFPEWEGGLVLWAMERS